ncbi:S66 peptidase family protein [Pseudochryseolinea flava]|uniref:LD-carboxypeptidase n=1 Tax=Pseudochryseolinea flava TaxID=2059302 RepID=A0A364YB69_9BACT|nr:LD-carboxypeptidase [Pseudochryseolinea flava]RAW03058.1 LD-carboxypeptidase [Pseudochryseolinea flava]
MIRPPFLQAGDKIGMVAPGRKVSPADVDIATQHFKSWGLEVVLAPNLFSRDEYYLSATDDQRMEDYQQMLDDPQIRAIVNARGGYGSTRILDRLDFTAFTKNPKWIVGFSDVTAIHLAVHRLNVESIHGIMPIVFGKNDAPNSINSLKNTLFGILPDIDFQSSLPNREGAARGIAVGGNLSLVVDSIGTSSDVDTDGKILILEEVDEYLYRMDRMIVHLKRAGKLKNLAGLVIGHITAPLDTELNFGYNFQDIITEHVKEYAFPVAFNFPSGHENPNLSWLHGAHASLSVSANKAGLYFNTLG